MTHRLLTALAAASRQPGLTAVLVPAGHYKITAVLRLNSNVVLRGEGPEKTVLQFTQSLQEILGRSTLDGKSNWSWLGGLIWIGPPEPFQPDNEDWPEAAVLGEIAKPCKRGDTVIEFAAAEKLKPSQLVLLTWTDPADHGFLQHIGAHPLMKHAEWGDLAGTTWAWPVEVASVQGNHFTLRQPLRVDIRPEWRVRLALPGQYVQETGVENLALRMPAHHLAQHLQDVGYNGIYFNRAYNCWAKNIVLENVDNGIIHAAAKNTTVTGLRITGGANHHATALRVGSADNLIKNFLIESTPYHGINTEGLSTGNVWRNGVMKHGTFDSHRAMSFEFLRTHITLCNDDGSPGGGSHAGPFTGARVVHWNIRVTGKRAEWVYQPDCLTMGALVGIQGIGLEHKTSWAMPHGDKGVIVADDGKVPVPADLFEAQLQLRLKGQR